MAVATAVLEQIEQQAAALRPEDYRRPGTSIVKFIGELSGLLAQTEEDLEELVAAGFERSNMTLYRGMLETLSLAHGERVVTAPETIEQRAKLNALTAEAETDRRRMAIVARHIADETGDPIVIGAVRRINKGSGALDNLVDVISLSALVRDHLDTASGIKPGGVLVDEQYVSDASARAIEVLQMRGYTVDNGVAKNAAVDRQNRLMTLCLNAQSQIKKYAYAAFFDRPDYYSANYATPSYRAADEGIEAEEPVAPAA